MALRVCFALGSSWFWLGCGVSVCVCLSGLSFVVAPYSCLLCVCDWGLKKNEKQFPCPGSLVFEQIRFGGVLSKRFQNAPGSKIQDAQKWRRFRSALRAPLDPRSKIQDAPEAFLGILDLGSWIHHQLPVSRRCRCPLCFQQHGFHSSLLGTMLSSTHEM